MLDDVWVKRDVPFSITEARMMSVSMQSWPRPDPFWMVAGYAEGTGSFLPSLFSRVLALRRALASLSLSSAKDNAQCNARLDGATLIRFQQIILPHLDAAHNLARFLSRDADAAQDIVQDSVLRALNGFDKFRGDSPKAWLLTIVRNCHNDWRTKGRREPSTDQRRSFSQEIMSEEEDRFDPADLAIECETPETALLQRTEAERIRLILDALPEPFREILILRELEDLSYHEIALTIDLPIGTVMSRLARARKVFADHWRDQEMDRP